jgi:hypothetical protein
MAIVPFVKARVAGTPKTAWIAAATGSYPGGLVVASDPQIRVRSGGQRSAIDSSFWRCSSSTGVPA